MHPSRQFSISFSCCLLLTASTQMEDIASVSGKRELCFPGHGEIFEGISEHF